MQCTSCGKQRAELLARESKLWQKSKILMCQTCIKAKMEPRGFIILHGRLNGAESVADYIKHRRYCGDEITAKELVG
jgi:protein-arginine kinase activator protein McsA